MSKNLADVSIRLLFVLVLLTLVIGTAKAELPYVPEFTFEWSQTLDTNPPEPLPADSVESFRIHCNPQVGPQVITTLSGPGPHTWTAPFGMFPPGDYECYMTVHLTAAYGNAASAPSTDTARFTIEQAAPSPVIIFRVN